MKLMPDTLSVDKTDERVVVSIFIPNNLVHFSGHFPGLPILPGIVQVNWAIHLMEEYFGIKGNCFSGIKALKFMAPMVPDSHATITLEPSPDLRRVLFTIHSVGKICTRGQLLLSPSALL